MSTLANIRNQRAAVLDQIEEVAARPRDVDTAVAALLDSLERLTQPGEQILRAETHPVGSHADVRDPGNAIGVLCALIGKDEIARLARERMRPFANDGIPPAARAESIAALRAKLVALEEAEEREIIALEAAGHTVIRREDADVATLLRIWEEAPKKAIA